MWIGSPDLPGPARALELGSDDLPVADSGEIKLPEQQGLIRPFQPPLLYWASFQTTGPVLGPGSQKLTIRRQDYLFTDYSKNPPHEPGGPIDAARLYPLVSFSYPAGPGDKVRVDMIRVDLRLVFALEPLGTPGVIPALDFANQIGVFKDSDSLKPGFSIKTVFIAAEKPAWVAGWCLEAPSR